ncbi:MAG TPA: cytochrome c oxidase assembly protein [Solirubrobacteraceae bacterium]|nr:cytochrome c oxidase assembly protein [Solirubrobacteraceae bacterium]
MLAPTMIAAADPSVHSLHLGEFIPPVAAGVVYLALYMRRVRTLAREGRPVVRWRRRSFLAGVLLVAIVQVPPFDGLADEVLVVHMVQHLLIGDLASLLIVLGLSGPVLAPLLRLRATRPLRTLSHPMTALVLWAVDLYAWHLPILYELAIRHDLVHACEHACLLWFGSLLWLALIGPLPKPAWFRGWASIGYVVAVRFVGAVLANALIWTEVAFYPIYRFSDAARGINPVLDQNAAGAVMMVEEVVLTTVLLAWLFLRFVNREEQRQGLLDLAAGGGVELSEERAARAADADAAPRLRERLLQAVGETSQPDGRGHAERRHAERGYAGR